MTDTTFEAQQVTYEIDGIDFICDVTCDPGTASTFIGGVVEVFASNMMSGVLYTGSASIISALSLRGTFASRAVPAGEYLVQLLATPVGYGVQTVYEGSWLVKKTLKP